MPVELVELAVFHMLPRAMMIAAVNVRLKFKLLNYVLKHFIQYKYKGTNNFVPYVVTASSVLDFQTCVKQFLIDFEQLFLLNVKR